MKNRISRFIPLPASDKWRPIQNHLGLAAALILPLVILSCATVNRVLIAPPDIPNATFVGSDACSECHDDINSVFHTATHSEIRLVDNESLDIGCESCHGPGSVHVDSGGAFATIVNPRKSPDTCFRCHLNSRAEFHLPSHHSIQEGDMTCSDCHDSHQGPAIRGESTALLGRDATCLQCHTAQRGPFVFEHEAMREGCTICHKPHGSVNAKMLTERGANLCLKCHVQLRSSDLVIGGIPHSYLMQRGTCWTAGCHEAVHGSHVSTTLRF